MEHIMVAVAIGMGLVFGIGVMTGVIVMIAMAVRREDRAYTLTGRPPDVTARGVRRLVRLGLRNVIPSGAGREQR